jgi:TetR/AcrR family transcriptional regulator, transcriptional repressor for nem operon
MFGVRYPRDRKAATRTRILDAAARLFRASGYDGVGVDAIMDEVGLTAGGFYSHFSSKEALFSEAMAIALAPGKKLLPAKTPSTTQAADPLVALIKRYLSRAHRDTVADGCPLPTLSPDVARKSDATRENYQQQFLKFVDEIEALLPRTSVGRRERALSLIAQCAGGVMLSRAVKDQDLSDQILKSCRDAAIKIATRE